MKITGTMKTTAILIIIFGLLVFLKGDQSNNFEKFVFILFSIYRWLLVVAGIISISDTLNETD